MPTVDTQPTTLDRVAAVVRRDLKVPPAMTLDPDAPLIGGRMDIDSLDLLLVVVSLDKEFGVKIASPAMGREVFASLRALSQYVDRQLAGGSTGDASVDQSPATLAALLDRLPHRPPFRFLSELTAIEPGRCGAAIWQVAGDESFFAGHFPGRPIVPGVLLAEALAQLSGIITATQSSSKIQARLAKAEVKFLQPVAPPRKIELTSRVRGTVDALSCYDVQAMVEGRPVAEGAIYLAWG